MMTGLLGMTIFLIWSMNELFLPTYYQYTKVSMLEESYSETNEIVSRDKNYNENIDALSEESTLALEILSANNATNVYVFRLADYFGEYILFL